MKKLFTLYLASVLAILVLTASCSNANTTNKKITESKTETTALKTTAAKTEVATETVKEKTVKTKSPTEKKEKKVKTVPTTTPPTQGKTKPNTRVVVTQPAKGSFSVSDLVFSYKGKKISLNDKIEDVFEKFGEDYSLGEISDTQFDYEYDGFTVTSYTKNKVERVESISVDGENISTPKGVKIGTYASRLKRYYGDAKKVTETEYIYGSGSKTLVFNYEDNLVTEFSYIYKH